MRYLYFLVLIFSLFLVACQRNEDIQISVVPNQPFFKSVTLAYMDTTGLISKPVTVTNVIDTTNLIDSVIVKDRTVDLKNIWVSANLEAGCSVLPLDGSPKFGAYGDFTKSPKYRVTAASGRTADWNLVVGYYVPVIGCMDDRWTGKLNCVDGIWSSFSPTDCVGEKINNSCTNFKVTFKFWNYEPLVTTLELSLGDYDLNTFQGPVTLVNDVNVVGWGYDLMFHKGSAGTYNLLSSELNLVLNFDGYDLPAGDHKYKFNISK